MLLGKPSLFLDISDIGHKDINVSFSVQDILNTDEYLMRSARQQQCKLRKPNQKANKSGQKK